MKKLTKKSRKTLVLKRETLQKLNTSGGALKIKPTDFACGEIPIIIPGIYSYDPEGGRCSDWLATIRDALINPWP